MKKKKYGQFDFYIAVHNEMIPGSGEDAFLCIPEQGVTAVFDGCGGLGSRRYPSENNRTGAYLAAAKAAETLRICAEESDISAASFADKYETRIKSAISDYNTELNIKNGTPPLRTDMIKSLPSTAAVALIDLKTGICDCIWAGDSHIYIMDDSGLHCLNYGEDETFSCDARLINYINADMPFNFEKRRIALKLPFAVIAATDGAYAYFRTPMEFEYMLLQTLFGASSPQNWEELLNRKIAEYAGDDYTLTATFMGYGGFAKVKEIFALRYRHMYVNYIEPLAQAASDSFEQYTAVMWELYKKDFLHGVTEQDAY
ncbi:MAG: hypothetical protein ACYCWE_02280 [Eubacteriales bacterium]